MREHRAAELAVGDVEGAPAAVRVVAAGVDHRRVEHHGIAGGQLAAARARQRFLGELRRAVEHLLLGRGIAAPVASRHHPERVVVVQGDVPREHAGRVGLAVRLQAAQRKRGRRPQHRVPVPLEDLAERLARLREQGGRVESCLRRVHDPPVDVQHPIRHQRVEQSRGVPVDEVVERGVRHAVGVPAHVRVAARALPRPVQEQLGGCADRLKLLRVDRAAHDQIALVQDRLRLGGLPVHVQPRRLRAPTMPAQPAAGKGPFMLRGVGHGAAVGLGSCAYEQSIRLEFRDKRYAVTRRDGQYQYCDPQAGPLPARLGPEQLLLDMRVFDAAPKRCSIGPWLPLTTRCA